MLKDGTKVLRTYLIQARKQAGYTSRTVAAMHIHRSPEVIGRHERGEIPLLPDDALQYAADYRAPDIALHYCASCPLGRYISQTATDLRLPFAALRGDIDTLWMFGFAQQKIPPPASTGNGRGQVGTT